VPKSYPIEERLEAHSMPEPMTGCTLWIGGSTPKGYGSLGFLGTTRPAHRVSYMVHVGPIPDGLHVLHRCDTPACINPDHLFLGTNTDNVRDKVSKGRASSLPGELHPMARLTAEQVLDIRHRRHRGENSAMLAKAYGLSRGGVACICSGKTWTHVGGPLTKGRDVLKLTEAEVIELRQRRAHGETYASLSDRFGISEIMVGRIWTGASWPHVGGPTLYKSPQSAARALERKIVAEHRRLGKLMNGTKGLGK
jgi:hypothetical protein